MSDLPTIPYDLAEPPAPGEYVTSYRRLAEGQEYRSSDGDWLAKSDRGSRSEFLVLARPAPKPPVTVEIPRDLAEGFVNVANAFVPGGNIGKLAALVGAAL